MGEQINQSKIDKWKESLEREGDFSIKTALEKAVLFGNYDMSDLNHMLLAVSGENNKFALEKGINLKFFRNLYQRAISPENIMSLNSERKSKVINACKLIFERSKGYITEDFHNKSMQKISGLQNKEIFTPNKTNYADTQESHEEKKKASFFSKLKSFFASRYQGDRVS